VKQPLDREPSAPVSQVIWTPEVLQILARADVAKGSGKGAGGLCFPPWGSRRLASPDFPHLAGQSGAAVYKQLSDYRTGARAHPLMTDIAKALGRPSLMWRRTTPASPNAIPIP
jgi:cytochrome c553